MRNHKSKPNPRTSPAADSRRVVIAHGQHGVGTKPNDRRYKTITDPRNGQDGDATYQFPAPGARGPAVTNS
jgi:hypothetical protein